MLDLILDLLSDGGYDHRQNTRIRELSSRIDSLAASRRSQAAAPDTEQSLAAAVVRLLIKKGLITAEELAAEMEAIGTELEAIDAARIAEIGTMPEPTQANGGTFDADEIAKMDKSATDSAAEIKLELN